MQVTEERREAAAIALAKLIEARHETKATNNIVRPDDPNCFMATLEGVIFAIPGDWIIRGVKGEIYPCKPDIFAETYEQVTEHLPRTNPPTYETIKNE